MTELPTRIDDMPGGEMAGERLDPDVAEFLASVAAELPVDPDAPESGLHWLRRQFSDRRILEGLVEQEAKPGGIPARECITQSYLWSRFDVRPAMQTSISLPTAPKVTGEERRQESGYQIDLGVVRAHGIDPAKVLYYRATQPGGPKPEYYWTSDPLEVLRGLSKELGQAEKNAIILVSTLEEINKNGGLVLDLNDDDGVAVRQIGTDTFDQSDALFTFSRIPGATTQPVPAHKPEPESPTVSVPDDSNPDDDVW